MRRVAPVLWLAAGACRQFYGLDDPTPVKPCSEDSFTGVTPTDLGPAEDFSLSPDGSRAIVVLLGQPREMTLPAGTLTPINFTIPYTPQSLAISPEGDSFLFTASIEPPVVYTATRGDSTWNLSTLAPTGSYAGTTSSDVLGHRRTLVRTGLLGPIQEYVEDHGMWLPIGDPHDFDGVKAPNLAANGLTMVYLGKQNGRYAVFEAARSSVSDWFGDAVVVLEGDHRSPQLSDRCQQLYVIDPPDSATIPSEPVLRSYAL